jgi:hypothetical protein
MHENSDLYGDPDLLELSLKGQQLLVQDVQVELALLWLTVRRRLRNRWSGRPQRTGGFAEPSEGSVLARSP